MKKIRIGTRGSKLALWQANHVKSQLEKLGHEVELNIIKTKGDKIQHLSFDKLEGKGFFTKEIEDSLLSNAVDMAVHSLKDLPTESVPGLCLAALSPRYAAADVIVSKPSHIDSSMSLRLKKGISLGTSSARRKLQVRGIRPDLNLVDIRGNVPTRIEKVRSGVVDSIMIAKAGIGRLELDVSDLEVVELNPREIIPAPGQGVLALQTREENVELRKILLNLHDNATASCTNLERGLLRSMGGGCQTPMGAYCYKDEMGNFHLYSAYAKNWDEEPIYRHISQSTSHGLIDAMLSQLKEN
jgi:hydroxymethylbilane synthase